MESSKTDFGVDLFQQAIPKFAQFVDKFLYFLLNELFDVVGIEDLLFYYSQSVVDVCFRTFSVNLSALALTLRAQKYQLLLARLV